MQLYYLTHNGSTEHTTHNGLDTYVTGSAKKGLIADLNSTYLETRNSTCEFGTTLKLGANVPLTYNYYLV